MRTLANGLFTPAVIVLGVLTKGDSILEGGNGVGSSG